MPLNEVQKWQAEQLARLGFSHKAISRQVHHRSKNNPDFTDDDQRDLNIVKYHLQKHGLKVTDWREMRTPSSQKAAREASKVPKGKARTKGKTRQRTTRRRRSAA